MAGKRWTKEEDDIIRKFRGPMTAAEIQRVHLPHRTKDAIKTRMKKLYDGPSPNPWTEDELRRLDEKFATSTMKQLLAEFPRHTKDSIKSAARDRNLKTKHPYKSEKGRIINGQGTNIGRYMSKTPQKNNTTGVTGVSFNKRQRKFVAQIRFKRHDYYLGCFKTLEEAAAARAAALEALTPELERIEAEIPARLRELAERAARDAARDVAPEPDAAPENTNERKQQP